MLVKLMNQLSTIIKVIKVEYHSGFTFKLLYILQVKLHAMVYKVINLV